jgi:hypothetical protein
MYQKYQKYQRYLMILCEGALTQHYVQTFGRVGTQKIPDRSLGFKKINKVN